MAAPCSATPVAPAYKEGTGIIFRFRMDQAQFFGLEFA